MKVAGIELVKPIGFSNSIGAEDYSKIILQSYSGAPLQLEQPLVVHFCLWCNSMIEDKQNCPYCGGPQFTSERNM